MDFTAKMEDLIAEGTRTMDPFAQSLNMEILYANPEEAEGVMHVTPKVLNPYGSVHGGCLVALADTVAGHNVIASGHICVTQSSTVNFLRPAIGRLIYCKSKIQKRGKQASVVYVEQSDENGKLLTTALFTFSMVKEITPHIITENEQYSPLSFIEE